MATLSEARARQAAILVHSAGGQHRVSVTKSPFLVGRSEECDIVIPDSRLSRVHARFVAAEDGVYFIEDAGSRNGTFVNDHRCDRALLKNNDEIKLGATVKLIFLHGESAETATSSFLASLTSNTEISDLQKLRLFLEAARNLSSGKVVDEIMRDLLAYTLKITRADRGFVYLKNKSGEPVLACGLDRNGGWLSDDTNVSHSVVREALVTSFELVTNNASRQSALAARESIMLNELRTLIAIPLRVRHAIRDRGPEESADGVLYLDSQLVSGNISEVSHQVLQALASECAAVLESAKLVAAEQAAQQHRKEMEIAASIQRSLVSTSEAGSDFARVVAQSEPCREVGGDFFDVDIAENTVTVIVADVSGKGVSAALLASMIHGMFHSQVSGGVSLVNAISSINRFLCSRVAGLKYATLVGAQLKRDGTLQIVNCGHVPALITDNGAVVPVMDGDTPIGLLPGAGFHVIEQHLNVGARLCIFTDGISETENRQGEEFGAGRVEECLFEAEPVISVMNKVRLFSDSQEVQDDRTILLLERTR
ncbi:MAG TPA: SpoIIE family protein phosphatase [Candidatus Angelobacter sp.]|jgi:serine phosphatase RsbU (regulator of sigma subunit)/pSer/pThr/pTyr-binding forkhead associated (FHA) protein